MRLRAIVPRLPEGLLDALEACDIKTDTDLLFSGTAIDIYQRISPCNISLAELSTCMRQARTAVSVIPVRTEELFKHQEARFLEDTTVNCSCGVEELDHLLRGWRRHRLIEISGDRKTCKSVSLRFLISYELRMTLVVDFGLTACHTVPSLKPGIWRLLD